MKQLFPWGRNLPLAALAVLVFAAATAQAHFVWIVPSEDGKTAKVVFSETPQPDDPKLLDKIAKTQVLVRLQSGREEILKMTRGKDAFEVVPGKRARLLSAVCTYGLLQKGESAPFLLVYHASALMGEQPAANEPSASPLEIVPSEGKFKVLWQRKPLADAEVVFSAPDAEKPAKTTTARDGTFDLGSVKGGWCGIRTRFVEAREGEENGKKYMEVRHYATLTIQVGEAKKKTAAEKRIAELEKKIAELEKLAAENEKQARDARDIAIQQERLAREQAQRALDQAEAAYKAALRERQAAEAVEKKIAQPEKKAEAKPDPAATKLLADARAARAEWKKFPGFTADALVNIDGKLSKGKVKVEATGKVHFENLDAEAEAWAKRHLSSVVSHRIDDGTVLNTPCAFADNDVNHPLGRAITVLNDELHSGYRVRDRQIIEVDRVMKSLRFSITILENSTNKEGLFLPASYVVHYWDTSTGNLQRTEAHSQTWTRMGDFDLPATAYVITATKSLSTRSLTLSGHQLSR